MPPLLFFVITTPAAIRRPPTKIMRSPNACMPPVSYSACNSLTTSSSAMQGAGIPSKTRAPSSKRRSGGRSSKQRQGNRMCLSLEKGKASSPLTKRCWPHALNWPYQGPHNRAAYAARRCPSRRSTIMSTGNLNNTLVAHDFWPSCHTCQHLTTLPATAPPSRFSPSLALGQRRSLVS